MAMARSPTAAARPLTATPGCGSARSPRCLAAPPSPPWSPTARSSFTDRLQDRLGWDVTIPTRDGKEIRLIDLATHASGLPREGEGTSASERHRGAEQGGLRQLAQGRTRCCSPPEPASSTRISASTCLPRRSRTPAASPTPSSAQGARARPGRPQGHELRSPRRRQGPGYAGPQFRRLADALRADLADDRRRRRPLFHRQRHAALDAAGISTASRRRRRDALPRPRELSRPRRPEIRCSAWTKPARWTPWVSAGW